MAELSLTGFLSKNPFYRKLPVSGTLNAVLDLYYDQRQLKLIPQFSRALLKYEIHELMLTEASAAPGDTVNRIAPLGFFEVTSGGMVVHGDTVKAGGKVIGSVNGFNTDHMPNHLNILIHGSPALNGKEIGLALNDVVVFAQEVNS